MEARAEERQMAKEKIGTHERQMMTGDIPGVDSRIMDPRAGSAQKVTKLNKTRIASIPVPT